LKNQLDVFGVTGEKEDLRLYATGWYAGCERLIEDVVYESLAKQSLIETFKMIGVHVYTEALEHVRIIVHRHLSSEALEWAQMYIDKNGRDRQTYGNALNFVRHFGNFLWTESLFSCKTILPSRAYVTEVDSCLQNDG